jgi:hypothetical protein
VFDEYKRYRTQLAIGSDLFNKNRLRGGHLIGSAAVSSESKPVSAVHIAHAHNACIGMINDINIFGRVEKIADGS